MEFRILGPLEVLENGRQINLGGAKQKTLLATLLLRANEVVPIDRLIDALWENEAPETSRKALQVYISQLRKVLGSERLETKRPGYLLRLESNELDVEHFEQLVAAGEFRKALSLWRGPALAEFADDAFAQSDIARLEELHSACAEDRIDVDLASGRHAQLVGELEALVARHPLRERLRGQLMLALYRSGRQAEALDAYQVGRHLLSDELGLEPGDALKQLQRAILTHDSSLELVGAEDATVEVEGPRSVFVGREAELAALRAGLDAALAGHGSLFLLVGEPGIGKSRLAEELTRQARVRGARVLVGRCWEAGGAPAYWPWVQSLRAYLRESETDELRSQLGPGASDLAPILPELREQFPDLPAPSLEAEGARFRLFDALTGFLKNAANARPLVIVLDDLHAADAPSLLLLQYLTRELGDGRLLVLGLYRDVDPTLREPLAQTLAELVREPVTRKISLTGLAPGDVGNFIELTTDTTPTPGLLDAIQQDTGGNPLFVGEIVRLLAAEGRLGEPDFRLSIPEGVREAIKRRVQRLGQDSGHLLTLASVLGREFDLQAVACVSGRSVGHVLSVLDEAMAERIVDEVPSGHGRLRFAHVLIRDTLYEDLTPARRMQLHRQAGEALEHIHAANLEQHLAEAALHFFASVPVGTADKAIEYASRAGDRAASLLAYEEAIRLYKMALTLIEDDSSRCDVLLALGDAQARSGDTPASKTTFREAAELAGRLGLAVHLGRAALGYGGRMFWDVSRDDAHLTPLLERAIAALDDEDSALRVRLLARLAGGPLRDVRFAPERRRSLSAEALTIARRSGDASALAYGLAGYIAAHHSPVHTRDQVELATELIEVAHASGDLERAVEAHEHRFEARLELGDMAGVDADLAAMIELASQLRQPSQDWFVTEIRAHHALLVGRFSEAESLTAEARRLGERAQAWSAEVSFRLQTYTLRREQGRLAETLEMVRASVDKYPTYPMWRCVLAQVTAELELVESREHFALLEKDNFSMLPFDETWLVSMGLLAEAAWSLGHATGAIQLYPRLLPYADRVAVSTPEISTGSVSRYLGLLAATTKRWDEATRHFDEAIEVNTRIGALPWLVYTKRNFANMLNERGARDDAKRAGTLECSALALAEKLGMRLS